MAAISQNLAGKHALVTGGARGIGAAITRILLARGAQVTMLGRSPSAAKEMAEPGAGLSYLSADVSNPAAVAMAFATAQKQLGRIDILVNNAGQAASAPFLKTSFALWQEMIRVNMDGAFHCIQAALPGMLEAKWGRIVNIASTAGLTGYQYVTAYCAAKHGLIGLTRSLALEVATRGVTVNSVCPGFTETDMLEETIANIVAKTGLSADKARADLASRSPQKRMIKPEEVANAVAWLCLPGSGAITGQSIAVAGGEVM